jgi:hypothetical protein
LQRSQKGFATHDGPRVRALDFCLAVAERQPLGLPAGAPAHGDASSEAARRAIFQLERVEVGVKFAPDPIKLQPTTASDLGR